MSQEGQGKLIAKLLDLSRDGTSQKRGMSAGDGGTAFPRLQIGRRRSPKEEEGKKER